MPTGSDSQQRRWSSIFSGEGYYYGFDPGPVARRAVRYHEPPRNLGLDAQNATPPSALDIGCGEGQDLAFFVQCGYRASGLDLTEEGVGKARRLLQSRGLEAETAVVDLRSWQPQQHYDLVVAVNSLQFLGEDAPACLARVASAVAPGGILGLSLFAREGEQARVQGDIYFTTLPEVMGILNPNPLQAGWQMIETAQLWQWNQRTNEAQPFVTLIARRKAA